MRRSSSTLGLLLAQVTVTLFQRVTGKAEIPLDRLIIHSKKPKRVSAASLSRLAVKSRLAAALEGIAGGRRGLARRLLSSPGHWHRCGPSGSPRGRQQSPGCMQALHPCSPSLCTPFSGSPRSLRCCVPAGAPVPSLSTTQDAQVQALRGAGGAGAGQQCPVLPA